MYVVAQIGFHPLEFYRRGKTNNLTHFQDQLNYQVFRLAAPRPTAKFEGLSVVWRSSKSSRNVEGSSYINSNQFQGAPRIKQSSDEKTVIDQFEEAILGLGNVLRFLTI